MNLHKLIYSALNGRNASVSITCNPQTITLTPATPLSVPTGFGFDGKLTAVTLREGDPCEATLHLNFLGFRKDEVRKI